MNIWKKPWFIPIVLTIFIVVAGQLYTSGKLTKAEALPEQEIRSQLAMIYDGEVKDLMLDGSVYKAKVSRLGAEYAVEVDAGSGKVLSLIQTKESSENDIVMGTGEGKSSQAVETPPNESDKADSDVKEGADDKAGAEADSKTEVPKPNVNKVPEQSKPVTKPAKQEKPQKTVLISEQQAMKIGLGQLPAGTIGEVDDVDFVNSSDGGYYLVQIEIDTDDDMDEVTYQIHAISGKVLTVTWDD